MATNDLLSQFKLKRLSQSIWFNLIHVLLLLVVIVGLGLFFYIHFNKISFIFFLLQHFLLITFNIVPPPPHFLLGYTPGGAAAPSAPFLR